MKIKLVSDLHLEFSDVEIPNNGCDVLILSGDIMIAQDLHDHPRGDWLANKEYLWQGGQMRPQKADRFRDFLDRCSKNFPHVVYVAGNHEFYHGKWFASLDHLREECNYWPNIYFLEKDVKVIDDIAFLGCTLWTDLNKGDPLTMHDVESKMNDHRLIRHDKLGYTRLRAVHTRERHMESKEWLKQTLPAYKKAVVVGHMGPTPQSIHPHYKDDYHINGAYSSNLSDFILDHPQIKLWTHGHTHHAVQYMVGSTLVACNPRGYEGYEPDSGWDKELVIEV
jgi:DNA repair exonuclease SbcCD nuclease subunit